LESGCEICAHYWVIEMIADEIFAEIEKRLGTLDERAKEAVKLALKLVEEKFHPTWQGENPTWNEWQRMNEEKRGRVMDELEQRNREWLERVRKTLGAFLASGHRRASRSVW
jgi:hypothetical protein